MTPEALGLLERETESQVNLNSLTGGDYCGIDLTGHGMEDITIVDVPHTPESVCPILQAELSKKF